MAKPKSPRRPKARAEAPRSGRTRSAGELMGEVGGVAFRRFGFVQSAIVSRWSEIVGERYARVSSPESIRFPAGGKSGGALTLLVEGAHGPLLQHLSPLIIERVNRFFGHNAIDRVIFRQGKPIAKRTQPERPKPGRCEEMARPSQIRTPTPRLPESLAAKISGTIGLRRRCTDGPPIPITSKVEGSDEVILRPALHRFDLASAACNAENNRSANSLRSIERSRPERRLTKLVTPRRGGS